MTLATAAATTATTIPKTFPLQLLLEPPINISSTTVT
jgi:hypothetical protein